MPRPDQDEAIADAIKFGRALGDGPEQSVLAIARYIDMVRPCDRNPRSMVKIVRQMEGERLDRLRRAAKPFVDMLEPDFDDAPFTQNDFRSSTVHMMLMGHIDGDLGDLPLAKFRDLRDAYLGAS